MVLGSALLGGVVLGRGGLFGAGQGRPSPDYCPLHAR